MSNTTIFSTLLLFNVMMFGFLFIFGQQNPQFQSQIQGPLNCLSYNTPASTCAFPTFSPPLPANSTVVSGNIPFPLCLLLNFLTCVQSTIQTVSNVQTAIQNGLSLLFYASAFADVVIIVFFNKLVSLMFLLGSLFTGFNTDFGVPFVGYIMLSFLIMTIIFGFTIFRGNPGI